MATLSSSIGHPTPLIDPIHRMDVVNEGAEEECKIIEDRLSKWKAFSSTRNGRIAINLADPVIEYLVGELCKGVSDFSDWSADKIRDYKNIITGELHVWRDIKYNSDLLENRLNELSKLEKRDEDKEKLDVNLKTSPEVAKYVEK